LNPELKVAVLMGGIGSERQVSLQSGANITSALREGKTDVIACDITPDDLGILDDKSIDVFFLGLHGEFGEDGGIQDILEQKNLAYTGSDSRASRLAFDKIASKIAFRNAGVNVAGDVTVTAETDLADLAERLTKVGETFVVKPIRQGSSVGVTIVEGPQKAAQTARQCFGQYGDCMVERFIEGREITVGIVNGRALPIIEIRSRTPFYDYHAKYLDDATEYLFGTVDDADVVARVQAAAVVCFDSLGCRHLGRVDMMLTDDNVEYVLEINTLPGFTSHSLLPMAAARTGLNANRLCLEIIQAALEDFRKH
jgi:D-alanine-D-alanine ligase